ncbi:MAG TPA: hypothetical protein H9815_04690 [Candidatus Ruania gallistercoris]|uniref:Mandelate racemase/muconate lactonizing enzyme family protein n=1 Tax=Candidatus Ruania gallistercoris TaxID=2838746 RepID=A0A9D2ECU4_9MICO|nr:hypothetical protein [Candidatus Ruania gallistercoris]
MTVTKSADALVRMDVVTLPSQIAHSWLQREQLATSMSRFRRHAKSRSSWRGQHERVILRLHTRDGRVGIGATRGSAAATVLTDHLAHLLQGRSADDHETLYEELVGSQLTYGPSGIGAAAVSAIDLALWDLRAQGAECSLARLLSPETTPGTSLPCYTTIHPEGTDPVSAFGGVKLAARFGPYDGPEGLDHQVEDIRRVQARVDTGTLVMIDAACGWDLDFTLSLLDRLGDQTVDWLEDPLLPSERDSYAHLAERLDGSPTAICLGNYDFSELDGLRTITDGHVDVYQPDVTWVGGLTAARRLWERASSAGMAVAPHYGAMHPWTVHLMAAMDDTALAEYIPGALVDGDRGDFPALPLPEAGAQPVPAEQGASARVSESFLSEGVVSLAL